MVVNNNMTDLDPTGTLEWLDAFASTVKYEGKARAQFILQALLHKAYLAGVVLDKTMFLSPYLNTISVHEQPPYPGDLVLEQRIDAAIRWNAIVMVLRAKDKVGGVGGHLSSYASIATLYEVGQQHFFRATHDQILGDLVYFQGHSAEGNYARAFLEGRLQEEQLDNFRQEVGGHGLSSYPHPWLMPTFWQFATVSLGLGPLQAVYQARFIKYLHNRKLLPETGRKVWAFCGDGEMDEPESLAGILLAGREHLDNLIFVVNCNLQRLDGLVRGNGKIINELEGQFRAAGWLVIKLLWDSNWDQLLAQDDRGLLQMRLASLVDGDLQNMYTLAASERRSLLADNNPALHDLLAQLTDDQILALGRGAHDAQKIYAAYQTAVAHQGTPIVILAQGIKGYGLGVEYGESRNIAHNQLNMSKAGLQEFCTKFKLDLTSDQLDQLSFYRFAEDAAEYKYLHQQRQKLGGYLPSRLNPHNPLVIPDLADFSGILAGSGERDMSTTMALTRILQVLLKDQNLSSRIVPIFSDEVRTFGMEALFRQIGIYSPIGQLYSPEDKNQFLYYREMQEGQVLQEGITEAGCMASWIAAATAYSTHQLPMIPFFVYYSMFGFQRVGDFIWAASDMRARGFLIGATAGRTTLQGEGLQHQDGNSLISAAAIPNCRAYDPAFAYEMAVIVHHGLKVMYEQEQDVFYYIMAMNERYPHPAMPEGVEEGIIKGMYRLPRISTQQAQVQLLGSGAILPEVISAAELLTNDFGISSEVFSVTSFNVLTHEAMGIERNQRLVPGALLQTSHLQTCLGEHGGPIIAATDYIRLYAEQIRQFLNRPYYTLGTDGFGRSDTRSKLRDFFEVDRYYIVVTALYALAQQGKLAEKKVTEALKKYNINNQKAHPFTV